MPARHGGPARRAATTGATRTAVTLMVVGGVVVGLLAAAGVVALLRGGDASGATAGGTRSPSPSPTSSTTKSPTTGAATTAPATGGSGATAPATTTAPGSKPASHTFKGTGNRVLKINKPEPFGGPVLVAATHRGSGSFGVLALDSTMHESDILINVAGNYNGTTLLDAHGTQTQHLRVLAHGPWTLTIKPVTAARSVDLHAKGTGDDVLRYTGVKGLATFDYRGGLNFVVNFYGSSAAVLVNEVGRYHGLVRIEQGPALIDVNANGPWTMRVAP